MIDFKNMSTVWWQLYLVFVTYCMNIAGQEDKQITCAVCKGRTLDTCHGTQTCTHHKCYHSITTGHNGQHEYNLNCDHHGFCERTTHAALVLRLECCNSGDMCNRYSNAANVIYIKDVFHQHPATKSPPTTTSTGLSTAAIQTLPPFFIKKGLYCEVCSGEMCGVMPGKDSVVLCPNPFPYCMNTVENDANGNKLVSKRCASKHECQTQWWDTSSRQHDCVNFDPSEIYRKTFSCSYCCETEECNRLINPLPETLFIGI